MNNLAARILSVLFHPIFMPFLGVLVLLNTQTYMSYMLPQGKLIILMVVLFGTLILPLALIPFYKLARIISSIQMSEARERIIPLTLTGLIYTATYLFLKQFAVPSIITAYLLACTLGIFLNSAIVVRWKMSSHLMGIGGFTGLMLAAMFRFAIPLPWLFSVSVLASGLLATARLWLNAHSPAQIYVGFGVGFSLVFFFCFLF